MRGQLVDATHQEVVVAARTRKVALAGTFETAHLACSDEDGDSAFGFAMVAKGIKPTAATPAAPRAPKLTSRFAPLMTLDSSDDDAIPDGDMLDRLNGWAHKVHVKSENAGRARAGPRKPLCRVIAISHSLAVSPAKRILTGLFRHIPL